MPAVPRQYVPPAAIQAVELPADCAARCRDLARALELPFSGIDLRRTPEGTWYCFEVNTSPGFFYFESATGLPIGDAVARLLLSQPRGYDVLSSA